jgi:oligo-1,6-glucosidase
MRRLVNLDKATLSGLLLKSDKSNTWWKNAVIYQIYPRSFSDSNGDGVGDIKGVISKLDYLKNLGVDAVWLSPIYSSPQDDNGYDISDYQSIDPMFGTLSDFDQLVNQAHERDIKVIMDLVVNHTSDEHPWFVESSSSVDNPKRDWYWWRKPREGFEGGEAGAEPNNWGSFFSGSAWKFDSRTGEYFLHLFSGKQPDLNWENAEVREAIYEMMKWWLDRGVDGFRMDVINLISKDTKLPDGKVTPGALFGDGFPYYSYGPRVHEYLREMNEKVFSNRERSKYLMIGEMPGVTVEQARIFTDSKRSEMDMVFQFEHVGLDHGALGKWDTKELRLTDLKESFLRWQSGLMEDGWNSLYWNNHDQPRAVSRFGNDQGYWAESAKLLAGVLHLQKGTPFIYQGEEIGMTNVPFSDLKDFRDIETINYFAESIESTGMSPEKVMPKLRRTSRDNARTPMQWNADVSAGFTHGVPWIKVNSNFETINVETQRGDTESVYDFYRQLIRMRHEIPLITLGDFTLLAREHRSIFAYVRSHSEEKMLVLANFSDLVQELSEVPELVKEDWADAQAILTNYSEMHETWPRVLRPWELRVLFI